LSLKAFLDRHAPGLVVLTGAPDAGLTTALGRQAVPVICVDARAPAARRWALLPRGGDPLPPQLRAVLAASATEAAQLERAGRGHAKGAPRVAHLGPFAPVPQPLPYSLGERDALAKLLSGRPVWLAVDPAPQEFAAVLRAHRVASRLSHRLLLIVALPPQKAVDFAQLSGAEGWHVAQRSEGQEPEGDVQVFLGDEPEELGLWYRLASITFLGGTLHGGRAAHTPFEAATLGSALLHGPQTAPHAEAFLRLARAGAARRVDGAEALGLAVTRLLSPDAAAEMAAAGWDVVTEGAPVMNRLVELVEDLLDGVAP
jgi:3-deoxy-D-manno-octulosonic-acid transferase